MKLYLCLVSFLFFGCTTMTGKNVERLDIKLTVVEMSGLDIPKDSLPAKIKVSASSVDLSKLNLLKEKILEFNKNGDSILNEVFSEFHSKRSFNVKVVVTAGIPSPYDAWTSYLDGKFTIFFNLDEWPIKDIMRSGLPVIKHEVTHVLLEPLLRKPESDPVDKIQLIVVDEGIAHFVGHPDRELLLRDKKDKWRKSEMELKEALQKLKNIKLSDNEVETLLMKANTGPFWKKYAAISGMFRAASLYENKGASGIRNAIKSSLLEAQ